MANTHSISLSETPAAPRGGLCRAWRAKVAALMPHPEARDFSDIYAPRGYVEVAIAKGSLSR